VRILGVADSDSYLKWGAASLARMHGDRELVILDTPFLPSEAQRAAAIEGLQIAGLGGSGLGVVPVVSLAELRERVVETQPDVVLLSMRGPLIRVVIREVVAASVRRPVLVSGLPGISIPATRKALTFRSQADLVVLHSKHEIRAFTSVAAQLRIEQSFGLATLPFLDARSEPTGARDEIVFAVQAKVPRERERRVEILNWLAETARRHPELRVVLKLRAVTGEPQTHAEAYPYDALLEELGSRPANLVVESGSMTTHLAHAVGLVTVSSTALIEAAAVGVPGIALDDFGVAKSLINPVFQDSNLLASSDELIAGRFRTPDPDWLDDNYFHADADNDWIDLVDSLVAARAHAPAPLRRQHNGRVGGRLRHVWDRKRALGHLDNTVSGRVALLIGYPTRAVYLRGRRIFWRLRRWQRRLTRLLGGRPAPGAEQDLGRDLDEDLQHSPDQDAQRPVGDALPQP
jgi:hypothetical protein